ncbi:MFS transporter [Peribacillus alkalitolerans]|uniref:MFS transporter n=1 Tax=Peribacillus alkalitolerans TaxID=1550385 RepID=UPI0013D89933|nr:MFS transporter [Peribacillus alkalitolerans]
MTKEKLWTRNFTNISLSNFFLFTSFYYFMVTLPLYSMDELHASKSSIGLLISVFLIAAIMIRPIIGKWASSDRKHILFVVSILFSFLFTLLYFVPENFGSLLLLRFLHGLAFGTSTTCAGGIVATLIPETRKGEGMGYFALSNNFAMVVGPFLGLSIMHQWGYIIMFTISAVFGFLSFLTGLFISIPKEFDYSKPVNKPYSTDTSQVAQSSFFEKPSVNISVVAAIFALVYSSVASFISIYAKELQMSTVGSYFFVVFAVVLLLSRPFTGKWFDQYGANVIIYPSIIIFAIGMLLLSLANSVTIFLLAAAFIGLGWGTLGPSFQTIAIQMSSPKRRGVATATYFSIFDIGFGLGSFLVGVVATSVGISTLYLYGSILVLLGILIYYTLHGKKAQTENSTVTQ